MDIQSLQALALGAVLALALFGAIYVYFRYPKR